MQPLQLEPGSGSRSDPLPVPLPAHRIAVPSAHKPDKINSTCSPSLGYNITFRGMIARLVPLLPMVLVAFIHKSLADTPQGRY